MGSEDASADLQMKGILTTTRTTKDNNRTEAEGPEEDNGQQVGEGFDDNMDNKGQECARCWDDRDNVLIVNRRNF